MRISYIIVGLIIIASFGIGLYYYPRLPDMVASHWDFRGDVNGYMTKFWGVFLMPIISVLMFALFVWIPNADPMKANIAKFRKYFDAFIVVIMMFLLYIFLLTIFWNVGMRFNMSQMISVPFAVLFYYCGILVENAKRNYFIGIRTPWTLSSDKVWDKTHKLGGKLFKMAGVLAIFGVIFPSFALWFVLVPVLFVAVYTILYSYFEYKKSAK